MIHAYAGEAFKLPPSRLLDLNGYPMVMPGGVPPDILTTLSSLEKALIVRSSRVRLSSLHGR
jgi:hypothetical protein